MSMLAEPRRRQRISVDPQNKSWSKDSSQFAHRMMSKMGWQDGKGLGARENGMTTHIKVAMRTDQRGIGADRSSSDNWLDNSVAFDALLKSLNRDSPAASTPGSPREPSSESIDDAGAKTGTRRNHLYRKFIRGKDLRNYDSTNLDEILASSKREQRAADLEKERRKKERRGRETDDKDEDEFTRPSFASLGRVDANESAGEEEEEAGADSMIVSSSSIDDYFMQRARERAAIIAAARAKPTEEEEEEEEAPAERDSEDDEEEKRRAAKRARKEERRRLREERRRASEAHQEAAQELEDARKEEAEAAEETSKKQKRKKRRVE